MHSEVKKGTEYCLERATRFLLGWNVLIGILDSYSSGGRACKYFNLGGIGMKKKKDDQFKLSYESDGKMDNKKNEEKKKNKSANFFNITPDSE